MNKIVQWNVNGAVDHMPELENLASQLQPLMICLQKCKMKPKEKFDLRCYNRFDAEGNGDVLILVHDSVPVVNAVPLETSLRAVAVSVALPSTYSSLITVCAIHIPCYYPVRLKDLQILTSQLPKPFILMANFPEHDIVDEFLGDSVADVELMNVKHVATHLDRATGHFFVEDFTFCSKYLIDRVEWTRHVDLCDSDHFPLILIFPNERVYSTGSFSKWRIEDANWALFEAQTKIETEHLDGVAEDVDLFTKTILNAANGAIPKFESTQVSRKPVRWWHKGIEKAVCERKAELKNLLSRQFRQSRQSHHSIQTLLKYLTCCDKARMLMKRALEEDWELYTSSINQFSPMPSNWKKIHSIYGKRQSSGIRALFRGDTLVTEPKQIADVLGSHYSSVSSNENYSAEFLAMKRVSEASPADFSDSNDEYYNSGITMRELDYSLAHHNFNSATGPDEVHPMMLKYLNPTAKRYLLEIYNKIWCQGEFPKEWKLAMIIPTLKKGKDKTKPASYRPVALTSPLAKVFEKIIQKRLMWELESLNYWSNKQYGFRKQRSTTQAIVDLQLRIKKAFDEDAHLYAVFFDLQTASDTVWKHKVLLNLFSAGIRGRMGRLIQSFLEGRQIIVRLGANLSDRYDMINGLPQGSVLSETLVLVALNDIQNAIHPPIDFSLYVDDLVVTLESNSPKQAGAELQKAIDMVINWATERGFKFSAQKTTCVDFHRTKEWFEQPSLFISGQELHFSDTAVYLGLTFDSQLSWLDHIDSLKDICFEILELLKKINNNQRGGDQNMLLQIYRSLIRSRLDYGCLAFGSANEDLLSLLDAIQNAAIRIATGAYPTSPATSLSSISGIFPLPVSRQLTLANFLGSCLSTPNLPVNKILLESDRYIGYIATNFDFLDEFKEFVENPPLEQICSEPPPWLLTTPLVNLNLIEYAELEESDDIPMNEIQERFLAEISKYPTFSPCYTDGSKFEDRVGAAFSVSWVDEPFKYRLPKQCSSFTAELVAIFKCLEYLTSVVGTFSHILIISDSLSALKALQDTYTVNPLVQRILLMHNALVESHKRVAFLWVPGHAGIAGNEQIDEAAKASASLKKINCRIYTSFDVKSYLKSLILDSWQRSYEAQESSNALVPIKSNVLLPFSSPFSSKRDSDILTRLRISHTRLTHSYLLTNQKPPICPFCSKAPLLVEHILISCPVLEENRIKFELPESISDLLSDSSPHINNVFRFLECVNLLDKI